MLPSAEVTPIAYAYVWAYIWTTAADTSNNGHEDLPDALSLPLIVCPQPSARCRAGRAGLRCTVRLVADQQPNAQCGMRAWSQSRCCPSAFLAFEIDAV